MNPQGGAPNLKDILLRENYVTVEDLRRAEEYARQSGAGIEEYLQKAGLLSPDLLGQAWAESFGVRYADLNSNQPTREQVLRLPEELARQFRAVIFKENGKSVIVTTDNPAQENLAAKLREIFQNKKIILAYSLPADLETALLHYRQTLETRFSRIIKERKKVAPEILKEIIEDALVYRASDIHFEPREDEVMVRFRIDGQLHEAGRLSVEYYLTVLNRIKVLAHLRTDEHLGAQDGAIRYGAKEAVTDIRVSVVPTLEGERVVMRLLSAYVRGLTLNDLGLSEKHQELLIAAGRRPYGMVLVVGPTGSGKTTTLYGLIKHLNRPEINIITIEDPVEYKITGVNHIQVNPQTNLTFAKGLRSILRQNPDLILVGEIRDQETAEIAVNAALTGHLLFSTFHANDAATALPRLLEMGLEPFLVASTLELVIAQRLVRRLCEACRFGVIRSREELAQLIGSKNYFNEPAITLYEGKGCPTCAFTGYRGRIAIFEFLAVTPRLEELLLQRPSTREIWKLARAEGADSMFEDGLEKVRAGITTLEELLRVSAP